MQEFEHFKVPPQLLCDLYRENLIGLNETPEVQAGETPPDTETTSLQEFPVVHWQQQSRGTNVNGFWILVDEPGQSVLSAEDGAYLENIVRACQREVNECLVVNLHGLDAEHFSHWAPTPAPRQVWLAGMEPDSISLPARFPAFQVQALGNTTYLWSPPLSAMKEKDVKARLWSALKQMFRIP